MSPSTSSSILSANRHNRQLEKHDGLFESAPSSSLSWRYLGMYIDTDCKNKENSYYYKTACRKVLWAAYIDPDYEGEGVAEYSFFERNTGQWNTDTCKPATNGLTWPGTRCKRLNCHETGTSMELLGVFKETDGLEDFTEQLFKHQGFCLWNGDKDNEDDWNKNSGSSNYEFMQHLRENFVYGCTRLGTVDKKGNKLYYDTKPLPGGNITYGVYTDSSCTVESKLSWTDILENSYASYENRYNDALPSMESLERWNDLLSDYKICQPCRAYTKVQTSIPSYGNQYNDEGGGDGEGANDPWGYDCHDDAGYTNCNQCFKFQTHTDMEWASSEDLQLATQQGTILQINVDGVTYGKGHYVVQKNVPHSVGKNLAMSLKIAGLVMMMAVFAKFLTSRGLRKRNRRIQYKIPFLARRRKKKSKNRNGLDEAMLDFEEEQGRLSRKKTHRNPIEYEKSSRTSKQSSKSKSRSKSLPKKSGRLSLSLKTGLSEF